MIQGEQVVSAASIRNFIAVIVTACLKKEPVRFPLFYFKST